MTYTNYFVGMHYVWWILWVMMLIWIFAIPRSIPGQRFKADSPLDVLRKRFASGAITTEEYQAKKKILEADMAKS